MAEAKNLLIFQFTTYVYSGMLNSLVKLGLNIPLLARTAALDMKYKIKEMFEQMMGGRTPQSARETIDTMIPFLNENFGFGMEVEFPRENLVRCSLKNCNNRPIADQSLAEGKEGCPFCVTAFMASLALSAFTEAEIDQFRGKAYPDHCVFEIMFQGTSLKNLEESKET
jgi:hypothetical protein